MVNGTLLILSVLISLASIELGLRALAGVPVLTTENFLEREISLLRANANVIEFDADVGWRHRANFVSDGMNTDHLGFRRPSGSRRSAYLVVGDSFTAGSGVRDEETWPALLDVSTFNAAVGGYGADQIILRAHQLQAFASLGTIIGFLSQDTLRNAYRVYGGGTKPLLTPVVNELYRQPITAINALTNHQRRFNWLSYSYAIHAALRRLYPTSWVHDAKYEKVLTDEQAVRVTELLLVKVPKYWIIVMMYGAGELTEEIRPWYVNRVIYAADRAGLRVIDTWDEYRARLKSLNRDDWFILWLNENGQLGHPSPAGHRFIARIVREQLP